MDDNVIILGILLDQELWDSFIRISVKTARWSLILKVVRNSKPFLFSSFRFLRLIYVHLFLITFRCILQRSILNISRSARVLRSPICNDQFQHDVLGNVLGELSSLYHPNIRFLIRFLFGWSFL